MTTSNTPAENRSILTRHTQRLSTILKKIEQHGDSSLYQHVNTKLQYLNKLQLHLSHDSSDIWSAAHLFDVTSSKTPAESRSILSRHIQRLSTILKKIEQHRDSSLYQHVNTKLQYLNKLQLHLSHITRSRSEGFEPSQPVARVQSQIGRAHV